MYHGFKGLCEVFLAQHPEYYIVPVRITGSAIETVFSSLKYIVVEIFHQSTILHSSLH